MFRKFNTIIRTRRLNGINAIIKCEDYIGVKLTKELLEENYNFYLKYLYPNDDNSLSLTYFLTNNLGMSSNLKMLLRLIKKYKLITQYKGLEFNQGFFKSPNFDYLKYFEDNIGKIKSLCDSYDGFDYAYFDKLMYQIKMPLNLIEIYRKLLGNERVVIPKSLQSFDDSSILRQEHKYDSSTHTADVANTDSISQLITFQQVMIDTADWSSTNVHTNSNSTRNSHCNCCSGLDFN